MATLGTWLIFLPLANEGPTPKKMACISGSVLSKP